jgi:hypothetical protein
MRPIPKYLEFIKESLAEPYEFEFVDGDPNSGYYYWFYNAKHDGISVEITRNVDVHTWGIVYTANGEDITQTNSGDPYRVLSTVVEITKDFMERVPQAKCLVFNGYERVDGKGERAEQGHTIRSRMYQRLIQNHFPDATMRLMGKNKNTTIVCFR